MFANFLQIFFTYINVAFACYYQKHASLATMSYRNNPVDEIAQYLFAFNSESALAQTLQCMQLMLPFVMKSKCRTYLAYFFYFKIFAGMVFDTL